MDGILAAGFFLFSTLFGGLTFVLWLRLIMRYLKISTVHPINHAILKITDPVIQPLASFLKSNSNKKNCYDIPCFIVLALVEVIKFILIGVFFLPSQLPIGLLIIYPIADLIVQPLNLLFYAIFIVVIMSWINPTWRNPLSDLLRIVTEPLLSPIRKFTPPIAGFDFSPFIVLLIIKVITITIESSMPLHLI